MQRKAAEMRKKLARRLTSQDQMSEAFIVSAFLAFAGGYQDAYTYIVRNGVFANAQTGNIVLMSTHLISGNLAAVGRYVLPVLSFAMGVLVAERIACRYHESRRMHWRQIVLFAEIITLLAAGLIPDNSLYYLSNMLVSFSCAMQVQSFRTQHGYSYASTMCIGNLRSGTESLSVYMRTGSRRDLERTLHYFGIILIFAIGAGIGGNVCAKIGIHSIWVACIFLAAAMWLMDVDEFR